MNKRESFRMIKRDYENNKRLFIKSYVEYHLATGRRPRGYDKYIYLIYRLIYLLIYSNFLER